MKMTPVLKMGYEYLKSVGMVKKIEEFNGQPHEFTGPDEKIVVVRGHINSPPYEKCINRQTLNRLIQLGYAKYTDKSKTVAEFIDKDRKCKPENINGTFCCDICMGVYLYDYFKYCPNCGAEIDWSEAKK